MILKNFILSGFEKEKFFWDKKIFFAVNKMEKWEIEDSDENLNTSSWEENLKEKQYPNLKIKDWFDWLDHEWDWFDTVSDYLKQELVDKIDVVKWLYSVQNEDESFKWFYTDYLSKSVSERDELKEDFKDSPFLDKILESFDSDSDNIVNLEDARKSLNEKVDISKKWIIENIESLKKDHLANLNDKKSKINSLSSSKNIKIPENINEKIKFLENFYDDLIDKINGYYFYENETAKQLGYNNDKRMVGVIAQEVNEILPEVIAEAPISSEYMTVKYDKLVPLLINAIKELKEKLNHKNCNCNGTT